MKHKFYFIFLVLIITACNDDKVNPNLVKERMSLLTDNSSKAWLKTALIYDDDSTKKTCDIFDSIPHRFFADGRYVVLSHKGWCYSSTDSFFEFSADADCVKFAGMTRKVIELTNDKFVVRFKGYTVDNNGTVKRPITTQVYSSIK